MEWSVSGPGVRRTRMFGIYIAGLPPGSFYQMDICSVVELGRHGLTMKVDAKDDAREAFTVHLQDLATGKACLAFRHAAFLANACQVLEETTSDPKYTLMRRQFNIIDEWSKNRNIRLVQLYKGKDVRAAFLLVLKHLIQSEPCRFDVEDASRVVQFCEESGAGNVCTILKGCPDLNLWPCSLQDVCNHAILLVCMFKDAELNGIDCTKYMDVSNDLADVVGFRNEWCEDVQDHFVETGDTVFITIACGVPHLLVIVRKFSPGINQVALPGGFKECTESAKQVCMREFTEEVSVSGEVSSEQFVVTTVYHTLNSIKSPTNEWDPRPRMSIHGSLSHGMLRVDTVVQSQHNPSFLSCQ